MVLGSLAGGGRRAVLEVESKWPGDRSATTARKSSHPNKPSAASAVIRPSTRATTNASCGISASGRSRAGVRLRRSPRTRARPPSPPTARESSVLRRARLPHRRPALRAGTVGSPRTRLRSDPSSAVHVNRRLKRRPLKLPRLGRPLRSPPRNRSRRPQLVSSLLAPPLRRRPRPQHARPAPLGLLRRPATARPRPRAKLRP